MPGVISNVHRCSYDDNGNCTNLWKNSCPDNYQKIPSSRFISGSGSKTICKNFSLLQEYIKELSKE